MSGPMAPAPAIAVCDEAPEDVRDHSAAAACAVGLTSNAPMRGLLSVALAGSMSVRAAPRERND